MSLTFHTLIHSHKAVSVPIGSSTKLHAVLVNENRDVFGVFPRTKAVYVYPSVPQENLDSFLAVCEASLVDSEANSVGEAWNKYIATKQQSYQPLGSLVDGE